MRTHFSKLVPTAAALAAVLVLQGCRTSTPETRITDNVVGWLRGPTLRTGDGADTDGFRVAIAGSKASVVNDLLDRTKAYRARVVLDELEKRLSSGGMPVMFRGGARHALIVASHVESFELEKGRPTDHACLPIERPKKCSAPGRISGASLEQYCQYARQVVAVYSRYDVLIKPLGDDIHAAPIDFVDQNGGPITSYASDAGSSFNGFDIVSPRSRDLYVVIKEWAKCDGDPSFRSVVTGQSVGWHLESFGVKAQ